MNKIKLISFCVNGIRARYKQGLGEFIKKENPDIIAFQKTRALKRDIEDEISENENYTPIFSSSFKDPSGTGILTKNSPINVDESILGTLYSLEGRVQHIDFDKFSLINIYGISSENNREKEIKKIDFLEKLFKYCVDLKNEDRNIVLCGDFNVAYEKLDFAYSKHSERKIYKKERDLFTKFIDNGFIDTFRYLNKDMRKYTWRFWKNKEDLTKGLRLDYFFVNEELKNNILKAEILSTTTNHNPISLELLI
jgi:exodeoxyribonuclease-3